MAGEGSSSGVQINEWWALSQDFGYPYLAQPISEQHRYHILIPFTKPNLQAGLAHCNKCNRSTQITFPSTSSQPVFAFPLSTQDAAKPPCSLLSFVFGSCFRWIQAHPPCWAGSSTITNNVTWLQPSEHQILRPRLSFGDFWLFFLFCIGQGTWNRTGLLEECWN